MAGGGFWPTVRCEACRLERQPEQQSAGPREPPGPGDFWLCPSCGELHRFTETTILRGGDPVLKVGVRRCGDEELAQLGEPDSSTLLALREQIRDAARRAGSDRRR